MPKKSVSSPAKQPTPSMSPSHPHIVGAAANSLSSDADADEEDGYVCPICESECTCRNREVVPSTNVYVPHPSVPSPAPAPPVVPKPRIKIKLTVPPSMRLSSSSSQATSKRRSNPSHDGGRITPNAVSIHAQAVQNPGPSNAAQPYIGILNPSAPKRRGRPPKHVAVRAAVKGAARGQTGSSASVSAAVPKVAKPNTAKSLSAVGKKVSKGKNTTGISTRKVAPKSVKRKAARAPSDDGGEDETDSDLDSAQFPTFVPASAVSSSAGSSSEDDTDSDDSSSRLTDGFDSDSSIKAEEENYLIQESYRAHDKARVKRELLCDEPDARKHGNGDWEIKSRKRSVGPSDGEMNVDSSDEDSDSETADEEAADGEEEGDGENDGDEDGEEHGFAVGSGYTGVATSWSDSEESNFDADLFFSNLTSDSESSAHHDLAGAMSDDDETESDVDMHAMSLATVAAAGFSSMFGGSDLFRLDGGLAMEVAGEWGSDHNKEAGGLLGSAWEWDLGGGSGSLSGAMDRDEEMQDEEGSHGDSPMITSEPNDPDEDPSMGVYLRESDGETTDDDFVGADGLPTQRAMLLFRWPTPPPQPAKLSTIDPRHTVSPERGQRDQDKSRSQRDSPRPGDILAGRTRHYWSGEEEDDHESPRGRSGSVTVHSDSRMPVMGRFEPKSADTQKVIPIAIINGENPAIPSPYPRRKRKIVPNVPVDSPGILQPSNQSGPTTTSQGQPTEEFLTDSTLPGDDNQAGAVATMDLSDVLDDSFLNSDRCMEDGDASMSSASDDGNEESRSRHLRNLNRWERIPMGTFRQTRTVGHGVPSSDVEPMSVGGVPDSPFSTTLLWPHAGRQVAGPSRGPMRKPVKPSSSKSSKRDVSVVISPVILPVRDGDRTPTQSYGEQLSATFQQNHKTRKELRKEKKMKRKPMSKTHSPPHNYNHQLKYRYHHQHHPNQKSRASNSVQRTNFFNSPGSSIPPLNL